MYTISPIRCILRHLLRGQNICNMVGTKQTKRQKMKGTINIASDEMRGRYTVAARDILPGEVCHMLLRTFRLLLGCSTISLPLQVVLKSEAFAFGLTEKMRNRMCWKCLTYNVAGSPYSLKCDSCGSVFYCSEACKATYNHSTFQCKVMKR